MLTGAEEEEDGTPFSTPFCWPPLSMSLSSGGRMPESVGTSTLYIYKYLHIIHTHTHTHTHTRAHRYINTYVFIINFYNKCVFEENLSSLFTLGFGPYLFLSKNMYNFFKRYVPENI